MALSQHSRLLLWTAPGLALALVSVSLDWIGAGRSDGFGGYQLVLLLFALGLACGGAMVHYLAVRDSDRRGYWKTACFATVSFVGFTGVAMLFAECAIRLCTVPATRQTDYRRFDPALGWSLVPDCVYHVKSVAKSFDIVISVDKRGFRADGQEIEAVDECPMVVIGDSHAFGFGLANHETLAHQLHRDFALRGDKVKVLNAGVPGYGLGQFYLRLKSLGRLRPGVVVVVLIHAANDLRNASCDVDYHLSKPTAHIEQGALCFRDAKDLGVTVPYHFPEPFESLNDAFQLSAPALLQNGLVPAVLQALRGQRVFRVASEADEDVVTMTDTRTGEQFLADRWEEIRKRPLKAAVPLWTEMHQFESERSRLGVLAERLLSDMHACAKANGQRLLVVVAPEPYDKREYNRMEVRHIAASCPQFTFEFGNSKELVESALRNNKIPFLSVQYDPETIEQMFVVNDEHTSGAAFRTISRLICDRVAREGWITSDKSPASRKRVAD